MISFESLLGGVVGARGGQGLLPGRGEKGAHTWMVRAVFPTPPSPRTTNLYKVIFPDMAGNVIVNRKGEGRGGG